MSKFAKWFDRTTDTPWGFIWTAVVAAMLVVAFILGMVHLLSCGG